MGVLEPVVLAPGSGGGALSPGGFDDILLDAELLLVGKVKLNPK